MESANKVTIDAAWFAELWKTANEADKVCEDCVREKCGECAVVKERDELKSTISRMEKSVEQMRQKDLFELEDVRKERDELKVRLDEVNRTTVVCLNDEVDALKSKNKSFASFLDDAQTKLAEARRCIEDAYAALTKWNDDGDDAAVRSMFDNALAIIRAYREKKEAK